MKALVDRRKVVFLKKRTIVTWSHLQSIKNVGSIMSDPLDKIHLKGHHHDVMKYSNENTVKQFALQFFRS